MRRMITNKQVVDVVNKAIEEGEIQTGGLPEIQEGDAGKALIVNSGETGVEWGEVGLSPEDQEKLDNSLQLPESAPAAQQLVGINTSGEQNSLGIGDGLEIANGELKTKALTIDWQSSHTTYKEISEEVYNNINNGVYDLITIKNMYFNTDYGNVHYIRRSFSRNNYSSLGALSATTANGAGTETIKFSYLYLTIGASSSLAPNTGYYISLDKSEDTAIVFRTYTWDVGTGTWSYTNAKKGLTGEDIVYVRANASSKRQAKVVWDTIDLTNLFMVGHADEYDSTGTLVAKYKVVVNMVSSGFNNTYTVTDITNS